MQLLPEVFNVYFDNRLLNTSEIIDKINRLHVELEAVYQDDDQIKKCLGELADYGKEIASFAYEYDCRPDIPVNGYRSLLDMGIKLFEYGIRHGHSEEFSHLLTKLHSGISHVKSFREASRNPSRIRSEDMLIGFFINYISSDDIIEYQVTRVGQFFLSPFTCFVLRFTFGLLSIMMADTMFLGFKNIFSTKSRKKTLVALLRRLELQKMQPIVDMIYKMNVPINFLIHGFKPSIRRVIRVKRQNTYQIIISTDNMPVIIKTNRKGLSSDKIKCKLFLQPLEGDIKCHSLMIFIQGGGCAFTLNNDIFSRHLSRKIKGLSILEVIYSKSTDEKFPVQIQEVLDVYLTLNRSDKVCMDLLGFELPSKIILAGDSGGACLVMSTLIALNDIKKMWPETNIQMPDAIYAFWPAFTFAPVMVSSYFMGPFVLGLNPILLASFADSIYPSNHLHGNLSAKICEKSKHDLKITMDQRRKIAYSPYLSPLEYDSFGDLEDVHLHIMACSQDALLDHSVEMAKKWKGKLTFDVMDHLPHLFPSIVVIKGAREVLDLAVSRLIQLVK